MATVTKPMALDESFNTTENTSRNVADVLAEGLDNIAESILPRAATEIPIESGSATNTKDYIDSGLSGKADTSDIPTVSDFIKVRTVTTTTNSNGFVNITFNTRVIILCAWATQGDCLIIPFSSSSATDKGSNQWWFKVLSDSMQVRSNFNITMYISYITLS